MPAILTLKRFIGFGMLLCMAGCAVATIIVSSERSPDGKKILVLSKDDGGATEPYVLVVSLYDTGHKQTLEEMPFLGRPPLFAVELRGHEILHASWKGNDEVLIECIACSATSIEKQVYTDKGVTVRYDIR